MTRGSVPHGTVIRYPYLWKWQDKRGETEGRKERPCCMVYSFTDPKTGQTHLFLLAISSQPPRADQGALEVPDLERRRAGLADWKDAWITVSEYNHDIAEASWYYDANAAPLGRFSDPFVRTVAAALRSAVVGRTARVDRTR